MISKKTLLARLMMSIGTLLAGVSLLIVGSGIAAAAIPIGPGAAIGLIEDVDEDDEDEDRHQPISGCTIGWIAFDAADGAAKAITAGHCGDVDELVYAGNTQIGVVSASQAPRSLPGGVILGQFESPDWAVIDLNYEAAPYASFGAINPSGVGVAEVGDEVCSQGRTTGWRCGKVIEVAPNWISTTIPRDSGDSGGPLYRTSDRAALGILSNTTRPLIGPGAEESKYYSLQSILDQTGLTLAIPGELWSPIADAVPDAPSPGITIPEPLLELLPEDWVAWLRQ